MDRVLTLRLNEQVLRRAEAHARSRGKSISQLVEEYLTALDGGDEMREEDLPPLTRSLLGCMHGAKVDIDDYYGHLEEKYL